MKAVILAAGEGTRLRPRTAEIPKPLVEVDGKPILEHCFETVMELGIREVVVVVGYQKHEIIDRYGDSFDDLSLEYAHQPERKGLAHAVGMAEPYVDGDFVVLNGDNIYNADLQAVLDHHRNTNTDITFPIRDVSPETARGVAVCDFDASGTMRRLVEKPADPPSTRAPAAFYVLPPEIFPACRIIRPSDRGEYELPDAINVLIEGGYIAETVPFDGWKININTEADLERAAEKVASDR